jgi:DNA-binding NtrC family response regulator
VRELRNAIERALLLCDRDELLAEDFGSLGATPPGGEAFHLPHHGIDLRALERRLLREALDRAQWNYTRTGALLGLSRDQVRHRVRSLGWSRSRAVGDLA